MSGIPSFRKFNYSLRPRKNVERKMLAETLARLSIFRPPSEYSYIGFGSVYFTDFSLFHRQLGFSPMFSIEGNEEGGERARFNAPFSCIQVIQGRSDEVLPTIPFDHPTIVWLDYDTELHSTVLEDVSTVVTRQCGAGFSGVFLAITVDVETERLEKPKSVDEVDLEDWPEEPVDQFQCLVGEANVPGNMELSDLRGDAYEELCRRVIDAKIQSTLADFNGVEEEAAQWEYLQLSNFRYADGAKMATFGGLLYQRCDQQKIADAKFDSLPFVKTRHEPYEIKIPTLTFREMQELSRIVGDDPKKSDVPISEEDRSQFADVYRYFPAFVEADV